ncbi:hypothetical protein P168DRAFT_320236 [Aspergillus campestris IBT 28561]|uniref:Ecp2 effector protein domain-containing protein n=1 Tax=Aspergillus campestris (strain IBT 28561) TaxID=1392248 RepID=A0A2I1CYI9_ASPC2|nr:uncharacterized protein P168DRAFT_320236 [Aspergillus campestris IBT 28561]PKY02688.1 hypothetical protein P168DRAFT_320236 [Aspergillus campestris IBT 28561]
MLLKPLLTTITLLGLTTATAIPSINNDNANDEKDIFIRASNAELTTRADAKPPPNSVCGYEEIPATNKWVIWAPKDSFDLNEQCGKQYLKKLRGRCGVITTWKCKHLDSDGNHVDSHDGHDNVYGGLMTFYTSVFCSSTDVMAAMGAASATDDRPDKCVEPPAWSLPPYH